MNPIQCHTELKEVLAEQNGFATGTQPKISQSEINTLNYKITEDYIKEHPEVEMYTLKTYLELASNVNRLEQAKQFI